MGRAPCCDKVGLKRGPWTSEEDHVLVSFIQQHGHSNWRALPKQAGLLRCGKSCRLRWINYLRPDIKRGNFSKEEEDTIIQLHEMMGNRWSAIAARLPGRTDNEIKNVWHTHLKKRLEKHQYHQTTKSSKTKVVKKHQVHDTNNVTTTTTSNNSTITISAPNSSQRSYSSSEEFSSLTDVSSVETPNNNNSNNNDDNNNMPIGMEGANNNMDDYFSIIDETFWSSEELTYEEFNMDTVFSNIIEDEQQVLQQQVQVDDDDQSLLYNVENNNGHLQEADSMDFWLDVFVQAGGPPELPEF